MKTDYEIQQNVQEQLKWEPFLEAAEIGVSVKGGIVTLSGQVNSFAKKLAAERAAKKVSGVKAVTEDIQVHISTGQQKTDLEIAQAVVNALKSHSAVEEERIKVNVENGNVTLSGYADWAYERIMAESAIEHLEGVKNVSNQVMIKPKPMAGDILRKINAAFERYASIDANKIKVSISDNKVTLTGKVRSWTERSDAEDIAWSAPGVSQVINQITVGEEEFELS